MPMPGGRPIRPRGGGGPGNRKRRVVIDGGGGRPGAGQRQRPGDRAEPRQPKAPQAELVRFAASDGELVRGEGKPGRGAYTCRRLACFERALARRAFNRTLRRTVRIDPALATLYTDTDG